VDDIEAPDDRVEVAVLDAVDDALLDSVGNDEVVESGLKNKPADTVGLLLCVDDADGKGVRVIVADSLAVLEGIEEEELLAEALLLPLTVAIEVVVG